VGCWVLSGVIVKLFVQPGEGRGLGFEFFPYLRTFELSILVLSFYLGLVTDNYNSLTRSTPPS